MEPTKARKTDQIFADLTAKVIEAIEADPGNWTKPWQDVAAAGWPTNAATGATYKGGNVWALWTAAEDAGYPTNVWATYKQWQSVGAQVRKGERSTTGILWKPVKRTDTDDNGDETERTFTLARAFNVFNAAQVDGYAAETDETPEPEPTEVDDWFARIGAVVVTGGNRAAYRTSSDSIVMPARSQFDDGSAYHSTLAHEHTHWTGHSTRLDRTFGKRFGDDAYAAEELVAELGAVFVGSLAGFSAEPRPDHASYMASWLRVLKADPKALWAAASKASAAAEFLADAAEPVAVAA